MHYAKEAVEVTALSRKLVGGLLVVCWWLLRGKLILTCTAKKEETSREGVKDI